MTSKVEDMEKELARVRGQVAELQELERKCALVSRTFDRIRTYLLEGFTAEELAVVDGVYLHLHDGMVDMVRHLPSDTDRGEGKRFLEMVDKGQAKGHLQNLPRKVVSSAA